ncbi:MAG: hypothetical protein Q9199_000545 [Rusavskia elegans]
MALQSDFNIDTSKFRPEAASNEVKNVNEELIDTMKRGPKWFQVGAAKYRAMQANGETMFPQAVVLDRGWNFSIPSRENGRDIPCRVMTPENTIDAKAVFTHIHGGGLAPENPFPAGPEDCFDAVEWLIDNSKERFGADLQFVGGEVVPPSLLVPFITHLETLTQQPQSAGGHLAMSTYPHLTTSRSSFNFSCLILNHGIFDLSFLPQVNIFKKRATLILDQELVEDYRNAFCPGMSLEQLRHSSVSPFYHELKGLDMPPAIFTCGTEDCLLDDTVMISARW